MDQSSRRAANCTRRERRYASVFDSEYWCSLKSHPREQLCHSHSCRGPMRSVPPRGSGWVSGFWILDFRFLISDCQLALSPAPIENRQLTIGNRETHPLPRGGTDLMGPRHDWLRVMAATFQQCGQVERSGILGTHEGQ